MLRNLLLGVLLLGAVLIALGYTMYIRNPAPAVPAVSAAEATGADKPYVVKLHVQWCAVGMLTKGVWSQIDQLPPVGAIVISAPLKIVGGSGSPLRVLAIVPA